MRRPQELVDRQQFLQPVSAVLQGARVAREAAGIARGVDHARHLRPRQLGRLRRRAGARRIEQNGIEGIELRPPSADCGRDRGAPPSPCRRQPARRRFDRGNRLPVALEQRQLARPAERQRAHAGKQIGQPRRIAGPFARPPRASPARRAWWPAGRRPAAARPGPRRRPAAAGGARRRARPTPDRPSSAAPGRRVQPAPPAPRAVRATGRGACAAAAAGRRRCRSRSPRHRPPRRPAGSTRAPSRNGSSKRVEARPRDDADADIDDRAGSPRSWKPASTRLPCRRSTKSARRRSPGAPTRGGSKRGASTPRCVSARAISSTFQAV